MGYNMVQKIIESHLLEGEMTTGSPITVKVDQTLGHDLTSIMIGQLLCAIDVDKVKVDTYFYCDHNVLSTDSESTDDQLFLKSCAKRYGIYYSKPGNGICHFLHCQRFARPGQIILGADSHTPTSGSLGALAIGSGGLTVTKAALGDGFMTNMPKVMQVLLNGKLSPGVTAKDIALEITRLLTVKGGVGYVLEYAGAGVESLSVTERQTIANMSIEAGATSGVFPSDHVTKAYLEAQERVGDFMELIADADAVYEKILEIDLSALEPMVAKPHMPDQGVSVKALKDVKPQSVFIGRCTNASYSDIARAALVLKGKKAHTDIELSVGPGSRQVLEHLVKNGILADLIASGARILEPACGPCVGVGQVPGHQGISVRTSNRNFPGRCGNTEAGVYLVSPETAAATAINGYISDVRDVFDCNLLAEVVEPLKYVIDDSMIIKPEDTKDPHAEPIVKEPNISDLTVREPIAERIKAGIVLKTGDNITTDDIIPADSSILKYIANIPKFAEYTFCYTDPTFYERAKKMRTSIVVGGENYGQGSSREHAAILPMYLGVQAVIAKSFARIHKENLFNYGILPLVFNSPSDLDLLDQDDVLEIENVWEGIKSGEFRVKVAGKARVFEARLDDSEYDKEMLRAGGAMNYLAKKA